jgi:hypothetical protein
VDEVKVKLHHLINAQGHGGPDDGLPETTPFVLVGFFLTPADMEAIRPLLTPTPDWIRGARRAGEIGRYRGIPVFPASCRQARRRPPQGSYRGVGFSYVPMTHVLLSPVSD